MVYFLYIILLFFCFLLTFKISKNFKLAFDSDLNKPQAIHKISKPRILGIPFFFLFSFLSLTSSLEIYEFTIIISFSLLFSIIGLFDDFGIKIRPQIRFAYQIFMLTIFFIFFHKYFLIEKINFLPILFENKIFLIFFSIFSVLTIVNAFNFIDGCDGLLILYCLLIIVFFFIVSNSLELNYFLLLIIIYLLISLIFNFPISRSFLGDFGSYNLGIILSLLIIYLSINNSLLLINTNEWFFAILLVYPAFEIFFSVIRRLINKKSPFYPDNQHLHSKIFNILNKKYDHISSNYTTSLIIFLMNACFIFITYFTDVIYYKYLFFLFFFILTIFYLLISFFINKSFLQK